jgi:hypothetical protein
MEIVIIELGVMSFYGHSAIMNEEWQSIRAKWRSSDTVKWPE